MESQSKEEIEKIKTILWPAVMNYCKKKYENPSLFYTEYQEFAMQIYNTIYENSDIKYLNDEVERLLIAVKNANHFKEVQREEKFKYLNKSEKLELDNKDLKDCLKSILKHLKKSGEIELINAVYLFEAEVFRRRAQEIEELDSLIDKARFLLADYEDNK